MIYHVIGTMSGSSMDGMDVVYAEITEVAGKWEYEIHATDCIPFDDFWKEKLQNFDAYKAREFAELDVKFGKWMGEKIKEFIASNQLEHKIHFIGSHGHTAFHAPADGWTSQIGHGGAIAAAVELPVISDLRQMDVSNGGQGAPIVPIAEKLLFSDYPLFLNLGGIANISLHDETGIQAYDITACNRVLDMLAKKTGKSYDKDGELARSGNIQESALAALGDQEYLKQSPPKSLANEFGIEVLYPILENIEINDALATMSEHVAEQIAAAISSSNINSGQILITGGGAHNTYLTERIQKHLEPLEISVVVPDELTVNYKEALAMCMIAVLRWREEANVLNGYSGADKDSIGGALWMV